MERKRNPTVRHPNVVGGTSATTSPERELLCDELAGAWAERRASPEEIVADVRAATGVRVSPRRDDKLATLHLDELRSVARLVLR